MDNQISAIHNYWSPEQLSPSGEVGITLEELPRFSLFQCSGWPDTMAQTAKLVLKVAGASTAPKNGKATVGVKASVLRVEPLKYWLIADETMAELMTELTMIPCEVGCALELSHSRTWIKISGSKAENLLNHFLSIDLRHGKFIEGDVVNTAFHHVGVTLWRTEAYFNLLIPRSFAASLWELLLDSAAQYGVELKPETKQKQ